MVSCVAATNPRDVRRAETCANFCACQRQQLEFEGATAGHTFLVTKVTRKVPWFRDNERCNELVNTVRREYAQRRPLSGQIVAKGSLNSCAATALMNGAREARVERCSLNAERRAPSTERSALSPSPGCGAGCVRVAHLQRDRRSLVGRSRALQGLRVAARSSSCSPVSQVALISTHDSPFRAARTLLPRSSWLALARSPYWPCGFAISSMSFRHST